MYIQLYEITYKYYFKTYFNGPDESQFGGRRLLSQLNYVYLILPVFHSLKSTHTYTYSSHNSPSLTQFDRLSEHTALMNIRSLRFNTSILLPFLNKSEFSIIALTDTWISQDDSDIFYLFHDFGYTLLLYQIHLITTIVRSWWWDWLPRKHLSTL